MRGLESLSRGNRDMREIIDTNKKQHWEGNLVNPESICVYFSSAFILHPKGEGGCNRFY